MSENRLLACFAHPDDESFGCAGVFTLAHQHGAQVTLVCATKGEAGEISDPALTTPGNLGQVRAQELAEAVSLTGVHELIFLGYRDSGMAGTAENEHPAAYARASDSAVTERLVQLIRRRQPHVLVTFDPTGGYGHPDHIAIHRHAVAAFHAASDPAFSPHLGPAWQARRLFYPALNRDIFTALRDQLIAQGDEPPAWGDRDDGPPWPDQPIHAAVDIRAVIETKWSALLSHRTQLGADHPFRRVPTAFMQDLLSQELFELAWPADKPVQPWPDLFTGLSTVSDTDSA
jgi:LmbE family N-acetylglucosaminyl deacetylase